MRRALSAILFLTLPLLLAAEASAQTLWTDGTGSWFAGGNWSAGVPNAGIEARIGNGGTAQIIQGGAAAENVILGRDVGQSGTLNVFSVLQLSGSLNVTTFLFVGGLGTGTMSISGAGSVTTRFGNVGPFGPIGTVEVAGPGAVWTNTDLLGVISGTLTISDGGTVHAGKGTAGAGAGQASATLVTGAGSAWTNDDALDVGGFGGSNVITVADGGLVKANGQATVLRNNVVNVGAGGAPGTFEAATVLVDGTLHFDHTGAVTFASPLFGTGLVLKDGSGVATIGNAGGFTGDVIAQHGQLTLKNAFGAVDFSAFFEGTLRFDDATVSLGDASIRADGGAVEYANATVEGGFLRGPGVHTLLAGTTNAMRGVTTFTSTTIAENDTATFTNFSNGGTLINGADATLTLDGATNTSSGTMVVNGSVLATDFNTDGVLVVGDGGTLDNGANALVAGGGSRTTVDAGGMVFLSDGTAWELNGARLVNDGEIDGTVDVNFGSLATGSGTFAGAVNVNDGGRFSPGNSPGTARLGSATFGAGGAYVFEVGDAAGAPGNGSDLLAIDGVLNVTAGTASNARFTIAITSLDATGQPGAAANFDPTEPYTFTVLTAAGGIIGFTPAAFAIDSSGFRNQLAGGAFSIAAAGNDLLVVFTPATPSVAASLRKCKLAIAKQSAAFVQAKLSALQQCRARIIAGKFAGRCPDDDPKATQRIAAALAKMQGGIAKACGGKNKTCNAADTGVDADVSRLAAGFPAVCTDLHPSCAGAIGERACGEVAACLGCVGGAAVDQAIALPYGVTAAPKAAKALNACQQAIGKRTAKLFTATSTALRSCWTAVVNGKIPGPCPDAAKAAPAIAKAEDQLERAIAKACCGKNKTCDVADVGVDADFDPVTEIGVPASCPGLGSCGGAITDVRSLTACVRCTTQFEVGCVTAAQFPSVVPQPAACR